MLLEIQDGITVNTHKIEGIEEIDQLSCKVYIGTRAFACTFPYKTLLQILQKDEMVIKEASKEKIMSNTIKKLDGVLNTMGYFSG